MTVDISEKDLLKIVGMTKSILVLSERIRELQGVPRGEPLSFSPHRTERGFPAVSFQDYYGEGCSIQESSLADECALWLGMDSPVPKLLVEGEGWKEVELPEGTLLCGRMHLTRAQVASLLPVLARYVATGTVALEDGPSSKGSTGGE